MRQSTLLITAAAVAIVTAAVVALPAFADSKTYGLSGFDRVDVSAGIDVTLSQGPFSIRADEPDGQFRQADRRTAWRHPAHLGAGTTGSTGAE